jgi:FtsZ-interacting cell division protein ZipA
MAISEFQLALIGTGAVAIVGVWAYNSWQELRQRKAAQDFIRGTQHDVLIDSPVEEEPDMQSLAQTDEENSADLIDLNVERKAENTFVESRIEPVFESRESRIEPRIEPVFAQHQDEMKSDSSADDAESMMAMDVPSIVEIPSQAHVPDEVPGGVPGEDCLDSMVELGMALPATQRVASLYAAWQASNVDFRKRIHWIAKESDSGAWLAIDSPAQSGATNAYVAIQLADRQGAIDKAELTAFCNTADAIVVAQGGRTSMPPLDEVVAHSRALDDVCASVDIQIAIHVVGRARQAFAGTKLRGLLEVAGLKLAPDGVFYFVDGEGRRLFSACDSGAVPFDPDQMRTGIIADVTFWLDVPRVSNGGAVFDTMLATARQLAVALDGVLVDEQRNPLADNVLAGIKVKVIELQSQMAAHGIPAGGRRALRLFA